MKRSLLVLLLAISISLVGARAADTAPFALNGWQFHDYNMPKLEEAVRRAPEYGVNFLIFSHAFFFSPEGFLASSDDLDPKNPPAYLNDLKLGVEFAVQGRKHIGEIGPARRVRDQDQYRRHPFQRP